jgi:predicted nucleotidyltransferase
MAASLEQLVEKLRKALDPDLISVVLYGSAAAGDYEEKFSDYNVLCVLRTIAPAQLRATETIFRWWREQGNPSPLLLTETELLTSTDCFPIEFHDIRETHRVLHGPDLVANLEIDRTFYRAQVEHDLRARLLRLRQKASGILSDTDVLRRLLADSISTFCVLLRHALILHGEDAPRRKREVVERARERFGIDAGPFSKLLDLREERIKAKDLDPEPLLAAYMKEIEKAIAAVDRVDDDHGETRAPGELK